MVKTFRISTAEWEHGHNWKTDIWFATYFSNHVSKITYSLQVGSIRAITMHFCATGKAKKKL